MIKRAIIIFLSVVVLLPLGACMRYTRPDTDDTRLRIVASLFPQYDFARQIAGDKADVTLLLPPGTESHTFDPKPNDMKAIYDADLFIYTGEYMEPWAASVVQGVGDKPLVLDASAGVELTRGGEEHEEHEGHDDHAYDPHIWLNPSLAMKMADNIAGALCALDPENARYYTQNCAEYNEKLAKLDNDFETMIDGSGRDTLVFGGRFAYIYFLERYGLKYVTAYDGCSAGDEPSVAKIRDIVNYVMENDIPCIYHEEFVDPKIARSIAEQTGAQCELFSTAHNVTKDEFAEGITYIDVMYGNLERIRKGLR